MPIGIITNCLVVMLGGFLGGILGRKLSKQVKSSLPIIFGISAMSIAVMAIMKVQTLPVVILAMIIGTIVGELMNLEAQISASFSWLIKKLPLPKSHHSHSFMDQVLTISVIFCASGTGIFGALNEGMTGDPSILLSKSILDLFTAIIFAATLGYIISFIALPQFFVLTFFFLIAKFIIPFTDASMIADFTACGGLITLAIAFRMCEIKHIKVINTLPAMVIVMPLSYLWNLLL